MYQQVKDEPFLHPEEKEEKIYQVQLGQRKQNDIFSQPSSSDFMKLLQLEVGDPTSTGQKNVEKICWRKGRSILNLSRTKCPVRLIDLLNQSHGPNSAFRNLNLEVQKTPEDYTSPLDKLARLGRYYKNKNFGFYAQMQNL